MGLGTFAAGGYTVTYKSAAVGLLRGARESSVLRFNQKIQAINSTNSYGESTIGGIYLGRDVRVQGVLMEWKTAVLSILFPFGANFGRIGTLGVDTYDLAGALILSATAGSPGSLADLNTTGPRVLTASKAVLCADFPFDVMLGPPLRETPFAMDLLPYDDSGFNVNFTFTSYAP